MSNHFAAATVLLIWLLLQPSIPIGREDPERAIVTVSDSPITVRAEALSMTVQEAGRVFGASLTSEVESRLDEFRRAGVQFRLIDILVYTLHGAVIEAPPSALDTLKSASGVLSIYHDTSFRPYLERSSRLVRVDEAHQVVTGLGEPLTGRGVTVAVIDTGVDYTHPDLGGSLGPGEKIAKGYDFVDGDADPMDVDGHGTGVAGIIAADGRLKGIAPEATIYAYRVVDKRGNVRSSDLVRALELASRDGAKVVNLSLGTSEELEVVTTAIRNVVKGGIVVVAATGNDGVKGFGEPAGRRGVIAVGASLNNITTPMNAVVLVKPYGLELSAIYMNGSKQTDEAVSGELTYVKYAREEDLSGVNLTGKIGLAERGGEPGELVYFSMKEANVAAKGGRGLLIYNSIPGQFIGNLRGPHNRLDYQSRIPVASLSREDGLHLKGELDLGVKINVTIAPRSAGSRLVPDRVAYFSSRGPVSPFYIKPDLVAPGVNVNSTSLDGGYAVQDGTSFAAPHVSGAAALLLQGNPDLTPDEVAGILGPTAKVLYDEWRELMPSSTQGSGRLDIFSAVRSPVAVIPPKIVIHLSNDELNVTRSVEVKPVKRERVNATVSVEWIYSSDVELKVTPPRLSITGQEPADVYLTASSLKAAAGFYEGRVRLSLPTPPINLTIPVAVYVNNASVGLVEEGGRYKVLFLAEEPFSGGKIQVTAPDGSRRTYSIGEGGSVRVEIPMKGEYWIDGEAVTQSGRVFARGVYSLLPAVTDGVKIPVRFLAVWVAFLVVTGIAASTIILVNWSRYRRSLEKEAKR